MQRSHGCTPRTFGFTLIELLVVVSIVALLISLLLPALSQARAWSRQTVCQSNVRQMLMALHIYSDEHDGYFPPGHGGANALTTWGITSPWARPGNGRFDYDGGTEGWTGLGKLFQYGMLTDPRVVYCPSQRFEVFNFPTGWNYGLNQGYRLTSYHYRLFGQVSPGMTDEDVTNLHHHRTMMVQPIALVSDIFHLGRPEWGPYPEDTMWAHPPPGLSLGFSDVHVEFRNEQRIYNYAEAFTQIGFRDHMVMLFWQLLDGDPSGVESILSLP